MSHDVKLIETAKRLGEDVDLLRAEFAACYVPDPTDTSFIGPWEEPVDTRKLLQELSVQIRRYFVIHDLDLVAVVQGLAGLGELFDTLAHPRRSLRPAVPRPALTMVRCSDAWRTLV